MGYTHNGPQAAAAWQRLAARYPKRAELALATATRIYLTASRSEMRQRIYAVPVPTRAEYAAEHGKTYGVRGGKYPNKPAWRRTGALRRMELSEIIVPGKLARVKNTMRYAQRRHALQGRRAAPWRLHALRAAKEQMTQTTKKILAGK
jgi:hypothetical protein